MRQLFQNLDRLQGGCVLFLTVFAWAFGCTVSWAIYRVRVGISWGPLPLRNDLLPQFSGKPTTSEIAPRTTRRRSPMAQGTGTLTLVLLVYAAVAARRGAIAIANPLTASVELEYREAVAWLPHSFDGFIRSGGGALPALACAFWGARAVFSPSRRERHKGSNGSEFIPDRLR
jgi:hypothetical protein